MSAVKRALRQFTFGTGKTAGRNSSGRITSFHRGGGAKRLQRTIDVKRNDASSVGVVERIEYDPNRSSRIALVRWLHGVQLPPRRVTEEVFATPPRRRVLAVEPTTTATNIRGLFAFNSMLPPGNVGRETTPKDVFFSAFSSKAKVGASASESAPASESFSLGLPRMAVAGAKPVFFAPRARGEEDTFRIRNWKRHSTVWAHRIKRKAAVSWHSKTL